MDVRISCQSIDEEDAEPTVDNEFGIVSMASLAAAAVCFIAVVILVTILVIMCCLRRRKNQR